MKQILHLVPIKNINDKYLAVLSQYEAVIDFIDIGLVEGIDAFIEKVEIW